MFVALAINFGVEKSVARDKMPVRAVGEGQASLKFLKRDNEKKRLVMRLKNDMTPTVFTTYMCKQRKELCSCRGTLSKLPLRFL